MSNFKKMVRERMAKTGESWQTAQRHVRAKGMKKQKEEADQKRGYKIPYSKAGDDFYRVEIRDPNGNMRSIHHDGLCRIEEVTKAELEKLLGHPVED